MILADKIVSMRKKAGWSQEELAAQLNVTRQSVSKWEGAQSMPDMDKVVQMSRLFGVTTDYLLKDEIEEPTPSEAADVSEGALRRVTHGGSGAVSQACAAPPRRSMALAAFLCVVSPVTLMLLAALQRNGERRALRENTAAGIGLSALFILAAVGVALFLSCASKVREFEFLEQGAV